jgi:hypothetical protein
MPKTLMAILVPIALGIMVPIAASAAPAHKETPPGPYQFVGFSSGTTDGAQGMLSMHALCQADFGETARICTSREFWLSPNAKAPTSSEGDAWIHPEPHDSGGGGGTTDFSGYVIDGYSKSPACNGWNDNTSSVVGLIVRDTDGIPSHADCINVFRVTCCAPQ